MRGNGFGYGLAKRDGYSRTLSARYYKDGAEILIPQAGRNPRRLTPRECARLMGFPDSFEIPVAYMPAYKQFGNSVVVPLIEAIAIAMRDQLDFSLRQKRLEFDVEVPEYARELILLPDVVDKETRSRMMSGIRGKNTAPEIQIRRSLHARGFRFRIHSTRSTR